MANDVNIDSLSIEISSNAKPAATGIGSLASAVKKFNDAVSKANGFGDLVTLANASKTASDNLAGAPDRLRDFASALDGLSHSAHSANAIDALADAMSNFGTAFQLVRDIDATPLRHMADALSGIPDANNRIPRRLPEDIVNLGIAAEQVSDIDWSIFDRMAAGLRSLEGLGEIRIPRIRGAIGSNAAANANGGMREANARATLELEQVESAAENAETAVEQLQNAMENTGDAADEAGAGLGTFARQLAASFVSSANLAGAVREVQRIFSSPGGFIGYGFGKAFELEMKLNISILKQFASTLKNVGVKAFSTGVNTLQGAMRGLGTAIKATGIKTLEVGVKAAQGAIVGLGNAARSVAGALATLGKTGAEALVSLGKTGGSALISLGKTGTSALAGLVKIEFKGLMALPSLFGRNLANSISNITTKIGGFVRSLGRVAFYRLVRTAIKEVTQAFSEGISNMYQWSKTANGTFAQSMDKIATSVQYLKNSLGALVSPLINALAPAIDFVVDKFVDAINLVNQFIASITGKSTYTAAKKIKTEWDEADDDATKSTDKATKKIADDWDDAKDNVEDTVKELRRYLLGFDELNILGRDDPDDSIDSASSKNKNGDTDADPDDNSASKKKTPDYGSMFETRPVESAIGDLAKQIREAFEKGEWVEIGELIADKFNGWIDGIDWPGLGKKLGNGINHIVDVYNGFMDRVKWQEIGKDLAEAANSLVDTVKWTDLGIALTQHIDALFKTLLGFVKKFDFSAAGKAFADLIWGMVDGVNWDVAGEAIGRGITGLAEFAYNATKKFPWEDMGEMFASGANKLFSSIDWVLIGKSAIASLNGALDALLTFIEHFDWKKHGEAFANGVLYIASHFPAKKLSDAIVDGLNGILDFIGPTISNEKIWTDIGNQFATLLNGIFGDEKTWKKVSEILSGAVKGALTAIGTFVSEFEWKEVTAKFTAALNDFLTDTEMWKKAEEALSGAVKGALISIGTFVSEFEWREVTAKFTAALNLFLTDKEMWGEASEALNGAFTGMLISIGTFLSKFKWGEVTENLTNVLNELLTDGKVWAAAVKALEAGMDGALTSIGTFVSTFKWSKVGDKFHNAILKIVKWFPSDKLADDLAGLMKGAMELMAPTLKDKDLFEKIGSKIAKFLNGIFKDKKLFEKVGETANDLIVDLLSIGKGFVADFDATEAADSIKKALNKISWDTIATETWNLLRSAVNKTGDFINTLLADESNSHWDPWKKMYVPDATSLGTRLGKKISEAIANIPWNQFLTDIKTGVGNLVTTMGDSLYTLATDGTIGGKVADALNVVFDNTKSWWNTVGESANKLIVSVLKIGQDFVDEFDEKQAAQSIQDAFGEIKWDTIASSTWTLIKSAFSKTGNFLDALINEDVDSARSIDEAYEKLKFNNQSFGTKLGMRISQAVSGIDWKQFGSDIGKGARALFDNFADALNQLTKRDDSLGGKSVLEDAIFNFINGIDLVALKDSLLNALQAVKKVIKQAVGEIINDALAELLKDPEWFTPYTDSGNLASDPTMWTGSLSWEDTAFNSQMRKIGESGGKSMVGGIGSALADDGEGVYSQAFFDKYLKNGSPDYSLEVPVDATPGEMLDSGTGAFSVEPIQRVIDDEDPLETTVTAKDDTGTTLKDRVIQLWEKILGRNDGGDFEKVGIAVEDDSRTWWDNVKDWWSGKVGTVEAFKTGVENNVSDWWSDVKTWWSGKVGAVESFTTDAKNEAGTWWSNVKTWWSGKVGAVSKFSTDVQNEASTWWGNVKNWWSDKAGAVSNFRTNVQNEAGTWWSDVKTWWSGKVGAVESFTTGVKDDAETWWKNTGAWWNGKVGAVSDFTTNVKNEAGTWWSNVKSWWSGETSWETLSAKVAIKDESGSWWSNVKNWWKSASSWDNLSADVEINDQSWTWWSNVSNWWDNTTRSNKLTAKVEVENDSWTWWDDVRSWWNNVKGALTVNVKTNKNGGTYASGGYIENGMFAHFEDGGFINAYAGGTNDVHGTMFLAGEAGPEIVGHLGGRTEVLNRSQLAMTMFESVQAAIQPVTGTLRSTYSAIATMLSTMAEEQPAATAEPDYDAVAAQAYSNDREIELLREQNRLLQQLVDKDNTVEITTGQFSRAQMRSNRRAGVTVIPVGT